MDNALDLYSQPKLNISNCVTIKLTERNYIQCVVTDQMHSWARCSTRARPDARAGGQTLN